MQCQDINKRETGNGRLVAFLNANSTQTCQSIRATPSPRVQEALSHTFALSLGALRESGGLLEFLWDADRQTLEEAFDEALRRVAPYLEN